MSSDTRARSLAWEKKADAKAMLEWYEGHFEIPSHLRKGLIAKEKKFLASDPRLPNGEPQTFNIFDDGGIDRKDLIFHPGMIQKIASEAERLQASADLGERFLNRTFASFDGKRNRGALTVASGYANREDLFKEPKNSLLFIGTPGTGKTHLAAAIANRLVERGIPTRFGTFQKHLDKIKAEFDTAGERHYLDDIKGVPMLILDDLGKERQSEWSKSILYDIVNHRYEHYLPIVITTNLETDALTNYCGDAVWSRLYEMCDTCVMEGEDYRKKE